MIRLGVIGYGGRMRGILGLLDRLAVDAGVVAVTDVRNDEVRETMRVDGRDPDSVRFYTDAGQMLEDGELDGVLIGTRCSLHTPMAVRALATGLPLFLEKPVATSMEQLVRLRDAGASSSSTVVVSFPLRVTPLVRMAKEIVESGKIGTVEHVQAWNDVPYGGCYYHGWYRDENETQGLFLQKATHDFDYINHLLGLRPVTVCAMNSKRVFHGDHLAGLRCDDCPEQDTCLESPFHAYFTKWETDRVRPSGQLCAFAEDTGNEDSGSAIVMYETGMHVCYSQNFFARKKAGRRGARLYGYKGTLEFDWYTDEVKVYMHHTPRVESYRTDSAAASHGGGDSVLVDNFVRVIRDGAGSVAPLEAGILSALMCLKAKESAATHTFQQIEFPH